MSIAFDPRSLFRKIEAAANFRNMRRIHKLAVRVKHEAVIDFIENDSTARPILIFVGANHSARWRAQFA